MWSGGKGSAKLALFLQKARESAWSALPAGVMGALSLPPWHLLCFLPFSLFFLWQAAVSAPTWKKALWWGFLYGMGWHVMDLYWLTDAILTRVEDFWWAVPIAAPGVSLLIAPLMALPGLAGRLPFCPAFSSFSDTSLGQRKIASVLLFAGIWVPADLGRTYIFTGFPWNPLGSALAFPGGFGDLCLQPASFIGVDGLSFFLVLFSLLFFAGKKAFMASLAGMTVFLSVAGGRYFFPPKSEAGLKNPAVLMVQGAVSETDIFTRRAGVERFETYLRLTHDGVKAFFETPSHQDKALVAVWPESAFPFLLDEMPQAQFLMAQAAEKHWVISGSLRRDEKGRIYNTAQAVSPEGEGRFIYAKSTLVPFGEYQPWIIPFNILPDQLTPGAGVTTWEAPDLGAVSPLVCYEMIFPGHVVSAKKRPGWILTISNDAWYSNSAGPWQHMTAGRLRSVEEGIPLVFVNNFGPSAAYSPLGKEIATIGWGKTEAKTAELPPPLEPTFFAHFGRLSAVLISLLACLAGALTGFGLFQQKGSRFKARAEG